MEFVVVDADGEHLKKHNNKKVFKAKVWRKLL